jgi:hypothetical protein
MMDVMIADPPPPPQPAVVAPAQVIGDRRAYLRDFRRDFPQMAGLSDVQVLDTAQRIVDAADAGASWDGMRAAVECWCRCDEPTASQVLSLTLSLLAPDWTSPLERVTPPPGR